MSVFASPTCPRKRRRRADGRERRQKSVPVFSRHAPHEASRIDSPPVARRLLHAKTGLGIGPLPRRDAGRPISSSYRRQARSLQAGRTSALRLVSPFPTPISWAFSAPCPTSSVLWPWFSPFMLTGHNAFARFFL